MTRVIIEIRHCQGCGTVLPASKAHGRPRKWCSDLCRKNASYSGVCVDCGAPTRCNGTTTPPERCRDCSVKLNGPRARDRWDEHRARVEAMWADGLTFRQICAAMGWQYWPAKLAGLRARGYDLPYRRTPEQVERLKRGAAPNLAKARAARRAAA